MKPSFAVIGCGRVGTALARHLAAAGYPAAGFFSRSRASAERAAAIAGAPTLVHAEPRAAAEAAKIVFLTPPDHAIAETCQLIADQRGFLEGSVVLHCSGALSSNILEAARYRGAFIGSMHPLQSFAAATKSSPFKGIKAAIEGDEAAVDCARQLAEDLGADPISIRTEGKTLYHAAAVVASNYLVTLMRLSFKLLSEAGVPESEAYGVLSPLIGGTLNNIDQAGIPEALTGPIARGDVETVADHLSAIGQASRESADLYSRLGLATIEIAAARGSLSQAAARQLHDMFSDMLAQCAPGEQEPSR